jgi:plastocyanin
MPRLSGAVVAGAAVLLAVSCASGAPSALNTAPPAPTAQASLSPADSLAPTAAAVTCAKSDVPGAAIAIKDFLFDPETIEIAVGEAVTFTNEDAAPHSAVMEDRSCSTANLLKGRSGGLIFHASGTYPYFCGLHPDMKGSITVQ